MVVIAVSACQKRDKSKAVDNKLFFNGEIISMVGDKPEYIEALVTEGSTIKYTGALDVALDSFPAAERIDLKGQTLLPGFIDGHSHIFNVGLQGIAANLMAPPDGKGKSVRDIKFELKKWIEKNQNLIDQTGWVIGFGYDDAYLDRQPDKHDLDAVTSKYPIIIFHQSGHISTVNSKALELIGYTEYTPDPRGGRIRRKGTSNEPNGILEENAHYELYYNMVLPSFNNDVVLEMLMKGQEIYVLNGFTTAQEGRTTTEGTRTLEMASENGDLRIDVVSYPDILSNASAIQTPFYSKDYYNGYRIGGLKIVLDGTPQGRTAWLTNCYHKHQDDTCFKGYPAMDNNKLNEYIDQAYQNNIQILAHCNGDAAIQQFIDAIRKANEKYGKSDRRSVAIHAQTATEAQLDQFQEEGIFPSFFPTHTFYWGDYHVNSILGEQRAFSISPSKSALEKELKFSLHHDAPVTSPNSMRVLSSAVTRSSRSGRTIGEDERISTFYALKAMTIWGAFQHFEEQIKGTLEPGKVADMVVLERNPLKTPPEDLIDISVAATVKGGEVIYNPGVLDIKGS